MKFIFLSEEFYKDYPHEKYEQMELKKNRPYAHIVLTLNDVPFAIPLRSHISHPHAFLSNKKEKSGIDFSKAVALINSKYIDDSKIPHIRPNEFKNLKGKDYKVQKQFENYVKLYKKAKLDENFEHREEILKYSTLQYFEDYISGKNEVYE